MINGFNDQTKELNEYERNTLLPIIISGLQRKVGIENAITSKEIESKLRLKGHEVRGARLRKIINFIRINGLIDCLMASSKGYWIEDDKDIILKYINSLEQRAESIRYVAECLKTQLWKQL